MGAGIHHQSQSSKTANFLNFDESLRISLSQTTTAPLIRYAFLSYDVLNPLPPNAAKDIILDESVSSFALAGGARVSLTFLRIHEHAGDIATMIDKLSAKIRTKI